MNARATGDADDVRPFDEEFARVPDYAPEDCPIRSTLYAIGDDKWKVPIVMKLGRYGTLRFGELRRALPHVRPKALTKALRSLEEFGLISREVFGEVPARVEYSLTPDAAALLPLLFEVQRWALDTRAARTNRRTVSGVDPNAPNGNYLHKRSTLQM